MKRRLMQGALAATLAVATLAVAGPATAQAATEGQDFGGHVASCAGNMDFEGAHNPGMHQGAAGWDGTECPS